jgi:hypothetical protein
MARGSSSSERPKAKTDPASCSWRTADGSGLTNITPEALPLIERYSFSPDGQRVLIAASARLFVAAADGSGIGQIDINGGATNPSWRPPDGTEILFMENGGYSSGFGSIFAFNVERGDVRTVLEREAGRYRAFPLWSPDGTQISYGEWVDSGDITIRTHVISADGTSHRLIPIPDGVMWQVGMAWSNDGTRLFGIRGYSGGFQDSRGVVVPVDGSGPGIEIAYEGLLNGACCSSWTWAPDDSAILGTPTNASGAAQAQVILDPMSGASRAAPWTATSGPTWQRLAP